MWDMWDAVVGMTQSDLIALATSRGGKGAVDKSNIEGYKYAIGEAKGPN